MQFILLIYGNEKAWEASTDDEKRVMYAAHARFGAILEERGARLGGKELNYSHTARTIRHRDGDVSVTDGPFAETTEVLGGYYVIEAADMDEALELATQLPEEVVEVRPLMN
jgi:hypothetical protein